MLENNLPPNVLLWLMSEVLPSCEPEEIITIKQHLIENILSYECPNKLYIKEIVECIAQLTVVQHKHSLTHSKEFPQKHLAIYKQLTSPVLDKTDTLLLAHTILYKQNETLDYHRLFMYQLVQKQIQQKNIFSNTAKLILILYVFRTLKPFSHNMLMNAHLKHTEI